MKLVRASKGGGGERGEEGPRQRERRCLGSRPGGLGVDQGREEVLYELGGG